ncbi:hypothetical protein BUALT_Bualt11G0041500 [Buddleja alternifolia]|uniref:Poly A polymerase head domain-containing protein n=1 Tax=Buddleja alternifolia TaxID=168488 RepID=A0AAV6WT80_9LAMI|nr:hypothetical protein BUALT_Bualt11G0041500 [Buddleja alternifolia]
MQANPEPMQDGVRAYKEADGHAVGLASKNDVVETPMSYLADKTVEAHGDVKVNQVVVEPYFEATACDRSCVFKCAFLLGSSLSTPSGLSLPRPCPDHLLLMAFTYSSKGKTFLSRLKPFPALERFKFSSIEDGGRAWFSSDTGRVGFSKWRKLDSRNLGIARSMIPMSSWMVLKNLRAAGFEAYLVGGCVRDLLLNKVPKDFDVITTARLKQVKKTFQRAVIVGQRFPICRVIIKGSLVEVSSFETVAETSKTKTVCFSQMPTGCNQSDFVRWKNCMNRDFTVNRSEPSDTIAAEDIDPAVRDVMIGEKLVFSSSLMMVVDWRQDENNYRAEWVCLFFDPFVNIIFDYTNAMMDLRSLKLRTVTPAHLSFKEDQARILRGLRLAARLNLSFSKETETAIYDLSSSVADLSKAAYLSEQADNQLGLRSSMLTKLLFNLDHWITCDRPCDDSLWVALLAFHVALYCNPQHAVVILTFASLLYHGTWEESIKFSRQHAPAARTYVPEIIDAFEYLSDEEIAEKVTKLSTQVENSVNVFINMDCLLEAMARFPGFPGSGLKQSRLPPSLPSTPFNSAANGSTDLQSVKTLYRLDKLPSVVSSGEDLLERQRVKTYGLKSIIIKVCEWSNRQGMCRPMVDVFVSQNIGKRVKHIFDFLKKDVTSLKAEKRSLEINYSLLKTGNECEIRFVVGKIILDTFVCGPIPGVAKANKDDMKLIERTPISLRRSDSVGKDENMRTILPSRYEPSSPESVSLARLFGDKSFAANRLKD